MRYRQASSVAEANNSSWSRPRRIHLGTKGFLRRFVHRSLCMVIKHRLHKHVISTEHELLTRPSPTSPPPPPPTPLHLRKLGRTSLQDWLLGWDEWPVMILTIVALLAARGVYLKQKKLAKKAKEEEEKARAEDIERRFAREPEAIGADAEAIEPLLAPTKPPDEKTPRSKHIPWLDHAKLFAMLMVNLNHTNEMFPMASVLGLEAQPGGVLLALCDLWGSCDMAIFFFCSGYVGREQIDSKCIRISAVTLLLPCFMVDTWQNFVSNPSSSWYSPANIMGDHGRPWFIGSTIFENHFWYLPGLFCSRLALAVVAPLRTSRLLLVCLLSTGLMRDGQTGAWPLAHTFSYFPVYIVGYIAKRHDLLSRYINAVRQRPSLRLLPASIALACILCVFKTGDSPHHLLFRPFCGIDPSGPFGLSPLANMWMKVWMFIYVFAWTGWLPVTDLGWVTKLGSRTLTNYMLYKTPIILLGKVGQTFLLEGLTPAVFWPFCYITMPFLTALLCSEPVSFAMWPLVMPQGWAGPLVGLPRGPDMGYTSPYWPSALALATVAVNFIENHGPRASEAGEYRQNWWGKVKDYVALRTPCMGPPEWHVPLESPASLLELSSQWIPATPQAQPPTPHVPVPSASPQAQLRP